MQALHSVCASPASEYRPPSHALQTLLTVCASLSVPAHGAGLAHGDIGLALTASEYLPPMQALHTVTLVWPSPASEYLPPVQALHTVTWSISTARLRRAYAPTESWSSCWSNNLRDSLYI